MAQPSTECRAFGIVPNACVRPLADVLRGMCNHYRALSVQEVVLTIPLQGGSAFTQLRLSRPITKGSTAGAQAQPAGDRWLVQHEGLPMRGVSAAGLAAAVREITDSTCTTANAPEFWIALGARQEYTLEKSGNHYVCTHDGYELQVDVSSAVTFKGPPGGRQPVPGGKYVIDVRVRVPGGAHVAACQAISSFGAKLANLVTLQPALLPIT